MTLSVWGNNDNETDPQLIKAKKEEIIHKNTQFNLQTHSSETQKEKLKEKLKTYVTEIPLNDEESGVHNYVELSEPESSNETKSQNRTSRDKKVNPRANNSQGVLSKSKLPTSEEKTVSEFIDIEFEEDYPETHEINAGTHKYVYTESVTLPNAFEIQTDHSSIGRDTTPSVNDRVYDDQPLNVVVEKKEMSKDNAKKIILEGNPESKTNKDVTKENKQNQEIIKETTTRLVNHQNSTNESDKKILKKLDDFPGSYGERKTHGSIHSKNSWQQWFNGFLPKEDEVGHKYQQELLDKIFSKENPTTIPNLRSSQKFMDPPKDHHRGDDYAPFGLNKNPWQSYTPVYKREIAGYQPKMHLGNHMGSPGHRPVRKSGSRRFVQKFRALKKNRMK